MIRFVIFSNKSCRMDDSKLCVCITLVKINCKIVPGLYRSRRKRMSKKKERKNWQEIINAIIPENVPEFRGIHFLRILLKITMWKMQIFLTWDFPGSPVVKTACFQCRSHGLDPCLGNLDPTCLYMAKRKKKPILLTWLCK